MYENLTAKPRLHAILEERGISKEELAEKTGIPLVAISRFDKNFKHVDIALIRIARALDMNMEDLFEITVEEENTSQHIFPIWG
jgi:DNA-binding Xre family transcriptional regulator